MKLETPQLFHTSSMAIRVLKFLSRGYEIRKTFASETMYPKEMIES